MDTRRLYQGNVPGWQDSGFSNTVQAGNINDGNWHHVVVTYDPDRYCSSTWDVDGYGAGYALLVYIDSVRINGKGTTTGSGSKHLDYANATTWRDQQRYHVGADASNNSYKSNTLTIGDIHPATDGFGADGFESTFPFAGELADFRIYNKALYDGLEILPYDTNAQTVKNNDSSNVAVPAGDGSAISCLYNSGNGDLNPGSTWTC